MDEGTLHPSMRVTEHRNPNPGILPPNSKLGGKTYGQWNAQWWKWALSLPVDENNPLFHDTAPMSTGQSEFTESGKVLFLGSVNPTVNRDITVSPGTNIFVPLYNAVNNDLNGPDQNGEFYSDHSITKQELLNGVNDLMVGVNINYAEIDGVPVQDPTQYRSPSGLFITGSFPESNFFGVDIKDGEKSRTVADGYYLMLTPLQPGQHDIRFSTTGVTKDATYTINVEPGKCK
jgi:hypothetical protein